MNFRKYKTSIRLLCLIIFLVLSEKGDLLASDKVDTFNIIIINSYSPFNAGEKAILEKFNETMYKNEDINVNIQIEYMDINKNKEQEYIETFRNMLNTKMKDQEIHLVVAVHNAAIEMMRHEVIDKKSTFYKTPMIYFSTDLKIEFSKEEREYIVGISRYNDLEKLVNWIMELHPNIEQINFMIDTKQVEDYLDGDIKNLDQVLYKHIKFNIIEAQYIQEVEKALSKIDVTNQANIVLGNYMDQTTSNYITYEETINRIKNINKKPIYTLVEAYTKAGTTGAIVIDAEQQGVELAEMGIKILEGIPIKDIPVQKRLANRYILDYKQIYTYDLPFYAIPQNVRLINKKPYQLLIPKKVGAFISLAIFGGILVGIHIIYVLIKQRKEIKENQVVYQLYEQTKEREQLKTDFIVNMSHEFRTPINVILSTAQLLKSHEDQVNKEYLDVRLNSITQNSNRLLRLVNNIIDVSKFEAGNYPARFVNCNIVEVVENSILGTIAYIKKKGLDLVFDTEEEEIITSIDQNMIERVILNLIANAIKFTPIGGRITSYIKEEDGQIIVTIADTGIGIAPEKIDFIFHKFYQVDNTLYRGSEGSGIGLCIVKEIINIHLGEIDVVSEEGKGTGFIIKLPIRRLENSEISDRAEYSHLGQAIKIELSDVYID